MSEKKLIPLIKTSTLKEKEVHIKDTMNFDRRTALEKEPVEKNITVKTKKDRLKHRKETMKTQKMSLDVLLKLDILEPFLRSAENISHDGKLSINDKIDILIDSYLNAKLSTRQFEGFKAIYDTYLEE